MLKSTHLLLFLVFTSMLSFAQAAPKGNIPPPPPPPPNFSDKHPVFGTYYKLEKYDILVPFNGPANISPKKEDANGKFSSYQYAFPNPTDDINALYGVDVYEFKSTSSLKSPVAKVNFFAENIKNNYIKIAKGTLLNEGKTGSDATYRIRQRMKMTIPAVGNAYVTSLYFIHKELLIRMYVFTKDKTENEKISDFFASIKYTK